MNHVTNTNTNTNTNNLQRIIQKHYLEQKYDSFKELDMFYELTKDIRNFKPLNEIQLTYVKKLSKEKIIELLKIFNICLKTITELFND